MDQKGFGSPAQSGQPDPQKLIDLLAEKTGQPREQVEVWVTAIFKMMRGSANVYDLSRNVGSFIAKQAKEAKPFFLRFGRSLLESFVEEQRRIRELEKRQTEVRSTIPKTARSTLLYKGKRPASSEDRSLAKQLAGSKTGPLILNEGGYGLGDRRVPTVRSVRRARSARFREESHNPWTPEEVLVKEPIFISSYRNEFGSSQKGSFPSVSK